LRKGRKDNIIRDRKGGISKVAKLIERSREKKHRLLDRAEEKIEGRLIRLGTSPNKCLLTEEGRPSQRSRRKLSQSPYIEEIRNDGKKKFNGQVGGEDRADAGMLLRERDRFNRAKEATTIGIGRRKICAKRQSEREKRKRSGTTRGGMSA